MTDRPAIKPLEWEYRHIPHRTYPQWKAETIVGRYVVVDTAKTVEWYLDGKTQVHDTSSIEAAKAAAQSDYASRIRSCLLDKPEAVEGEGEALKAEVKALVPTERLDQLIGSGDPTSAEIHDMAVELILWRRSCLADKATAGEAGPERKALEEAVKNALGLLDTPVGRRRHAGDSFYSDVVASLRAALTKETTHE
ncbi:hypothetical protein CDO22_17960 [Sinorhizobium meliloti]|uniref:hypothetical protein n=1 Tax=Rhizobium meliloti TaxID=382 RepID=UPI000B498C0F|nr:hypothetical protein [Sinorhizobium meliloti]ASQ10188.1 hypothetical protein CDO22_08440 [Sinorhizobium meliloti]ASQ11877.1 hypothetical protein CDO22_17960 [Sinorhizobium meliloti]MQU82946.1 hypothetical protein [Sinorhizobium meliloti]MQU83328.1 hypothetical protein [Sinorhizobium meliloti]MQU83648.1 hypothetical protein [Sinorhizobium meliloti]